MCGERKKFNIVKILKQVKYSMIQVMKPY